MGKATRNKAFWRSPQFRLLLAIFAAAFLFMADSDDQAGCGNNVGWIRVENHNSYPIQVAIAGENSKQSTIAAASTAVEFRLPPGGYYYFAKDLQHLGKISDGAVTVTAALTRTVVIKF